MRPEAQAAAPRAVFREIADGALLARFPQADERDANRAAIALAQVATALAGVEAALPGARSLLVLFEPGSLRADVLARSLAAGRDVGSVPERERAPGRRLRVPVLYGGEAGPDLAELAFARGLSPEQFAARHAAGEYEVAFLGFSPGFAYLSGLSPDLQHPRLSTPRTRVPAGSVAIGGPYTGIYPEETPGGWRLIGRAPVRLFDAASDPPALFSPGDSVCFEEIGREEFDRSLARLTARSAAATHGEGIPILRIASAGVWTSVQGAPRYRWSRWGVPPGGALDPEALAAGNRALGNDPFEPALEMSLVGPELEVLSPVTAVVAGGRVNLERSGRGIPADEGFSLVPGDRLRIGPIAGPARAYLCVAGGLARPPRASESIRLSAGDVVCSSGRSAATLAVEPVRPVPGTPREDPAVVRVVLGPDEDRFSKEGVATFLSGTYHVSAASDRRGIRLEGPAVAHAESPDVPPEPTPLGAVQVALDGQPIVLGPDRPVTGGYARIATVASADFAIVARARPGSSLRFRAIDVARAVEARSKLPAPPRDRRRTLRKERA